jgi:hypothetical protein
MTIEPVSSQFKPVWGRPLPEIATRPLDCGCGGFDGAGERDTPKPSDSIPENSDGWFGKALEIDLSPPFAQNRR